MRVCYNKFLKLCSERGDWQSFRIGATAYYDHTILPIASNIRMCEQICDFKVFLHIFFDGRRDKNGYRYFFFISEIHV